LSAFSRFRTKFASVSESYSKW